MANNLTFNPLRLDTASGSVLTTESYRVKKIRWVGGTTAGHQVILQDQHSNTLWETVASGSNYVEETDFTWNTTNTVVLSGIRLPTLGSGKLYIYY